MKVKISRFLLTATATLFLALTAFHFNADAEQKKVDDPEKHQVADVTSKVKKMKLKEGLNLVETTPSGERIQAKVQKGKIVGWVVTGKNGKTIPTTLEKKSAGTSAAARARINCWHCYRGSNGEINCFRVECPF